MAQTKHSGFLITLACALMLVVALFGASGHAYALTDGVGAVAQDVTSEERAADEDSNQSAQDSITADGAPIAENLISVEADEPNGLLAESPQESEGQLGGQSTDMVSATMAAADAQGNAMLSDGVYTIGSAISNAARVEIGGASTANGAGAQVYADNWTAAQRWYITNLGNDVYKIMNVASGKFLDVAGAQVGNGARVQQFEWNGTQAQQWVIESTSAGYTLRSVLSKAYLLDLAGANTGNGTAVQLYESNGTNAQRWSLSKVEAVLPSGVYTLTSNASGKVLDVSGGSVYNAANVQQYDSNGTMAQDFYLSYSSSNGYYTVLASASGLALDVSGASDSNGANVQLYSPNGTSAQRWALAKNTDGSYTFHSAVGGRVLDVSGASKDNGANVQTWASNGTNAQKWAVSNARAWSIPEGVYNIVASVNQANSLAVSGLSRVDGGNVETAATSTTNWAQKWVFTKASDGFYAIRNLNSRMELDVCGAEANSGVNVQQYTQNGTDAQLWMPELTAGGIVFRSKVDSNLVLDIAGASTATGANLQIYASNGTVAQKFRIIGVAAIDNNASFVFRNIGADKVLDVSGASKDNGAVVQLYEANGTMAQRFRVVSAGGNRYYLQNASSLKYIQVNPDSTAKVQQWEGQSGTDKQWEITLSLSSGAFTIKSASSGAYMDGTSGELFLRVESTSDVQLFALQPMAITTFKLYLDAGHIVGRNGYDSGATGNGYTEAELTSDLTDRILKICTEEFGLDIVDGKTFGISYELRTAKARELACTAFLSIHFDASGSHTGTGSMSIVGGTGKRNSKSLLLNTIIHPYLVAGTGLTDRGVSYRDDLAVVNDGKIAATLLEVCFIDNAYDMNVYNARRDAVARAIAEGILEASMRSEFS